MCLESPTHFVTSQRVDFLNCVLFQVPARKTSAAHQGPKHLQIIWRASWVSAHLREVSVRQKPPQPEPIAEQTLCRLRLFCWTIVKNLLWFCKRPSWQHDITPVTSQPPSWSSPTGSKVRLEGFCFLFLYQCSCVLWAPRQTGTSVYIYLNDGCLLLVTSQLTWSFFYTSACKVF